MGDFKMRNCNDKPDMNLNCPPIDQGGIDRMIKAFAPMQGRNYIVMEVRNNLLEQDRINLLNRFPSDMFRKIAQVQIGDASSDFKKKKDEFNKKLAEVRKKKADGEKAKKQKELKKK